MQLFQALIIVGALDSVVCVTVGLVAKPAQLFVITSVTLEIARH